jgi:mannan endo-1,4-beta-mannosidase
MEMLLKALRPDHLKLAYVLVWCNDANSAAHFYVSFPGPSSVPDFKFLQQSFYPV